MIGKLQISTAFDSLPQVSALLERLKARKALFTFAAALLIVAIGAGSVLALRSSATPAYQTQPVVQQDLTQTVTASGTVNPQNTVTVGTQDSGTISQIFVDYNSRVKKGQVLAKIDPSQLQAQLAQAQAALAQAKAQAAQQGQTADGAEANITEAQQTTAAQAANARAAQAAIAAASANVSKAQSAAQLSEQTVSRDKSLISNGYISQSQYDSDESAAQTAQAGVQSAQAALTQAQAQAAASTSQAAASATQTQINVAQAGASQDSAAAAQAAVQAAQAQVDQDELNLERTVITSPVDGTVIARDVSVGQTVAASLQTPTLFSIAQNLQKMEVDIAVGEPDIGNVRPGDKVSFSVLAFPNETFNGTVSQVREDPTTVSNVVTYTVIVDVDNPQNQLLPGMTANATIGVQTAHNALVVPAAALSFRPAGAFKGSHRRTATAASSGSSAPASSTASSPWGQTSAGAASSANAGSNGLIFVERGGKAQPVRVRVDLISGTQAAVTPLTGTLRAGDDVITASGTTVRSQSSASRSASPAGSSAMGGIGRAIH